jgi:hypothetical protein
LAVGGVDELSGAAQCCRLHGAVRLDLIAVRRTHLRSVLALQVDGGGH